MVVASVWDALTAIGTLALAVVTVGAAAVTLVVTGQDRKRTDQRLGDERRHELELLQEQQASDVYMVRTTGRARRRWTRSYPAATIVNGGDYTITRVVVRFAVNGRFEDARHVEFVPAPEASALAVGKTILGSADTLAPGTGQCAALPRTRHGEGTETVPVARWTDRWNQRWEYRDSVAAVSRRMSRGPPFSSHPCRLLKTRRHVLVVRHSDWVHEHHQQLLPCAIEAPEDLSPSASLAQTGRDI